MKALHLVIMLSVISCAPRENKNAPSADSVAAAQADTSEENTTPVTLETSVPQETERQPTWEDPSFQPDLFVSDRLDSMLLLLKEKSIRDVSIYTYHDEWDSVKTLSFAGGSEISYYRTEGEIYYLHIADIKTPGYPFKDGLIVGMPRREAIGILGFDSTKIETYQDVGTYTHEWQMGNGDFKLYKFKFSRTAFIGLNLTYENMD